METYFFFYWNSLEQDAYIINDDVI